MVSSSQRNMIQPEPNKTTRGVNNYSQGRSDRGHRQGYLRRYLRDYLLRRGSRASRRPSPIKLTARTERAMARPGKMMACWPCWKTP
jgi:hypothetical protein